MSNDLCLYVHWPFCLTKCPYCDFNSHVSERPIDEARWQKALLTELNYFAKKTDNNRPLTSIFFGGGTPSTMAPATTAAVIEAAMLYWPNQKNLEISLEANPTSLTTNKLLEFATAGVNRVSLGVQSFSNKSLEFLGREHSVKDAIAAIEMAQKNFKHYSFDLIYGLPEQSVSMWKNELNEALKMSTSHLSMYQLSIEKGTKFFTNKVSEANIETGADLFTLTKELTTQAGLNHYEISNYAFPEEECQHNVSIWRGNDYIGIGPGAHGRMAKGKNTVASYQVYNPARWLEKVEKDGHATAKQTCLTADERAEEVVMTGLRLTEGIKAHRFSNILSSKAISRLKKEGYLILEGGILRTTDIGQLCLNSVIKELLGN